jgi:predicted transposase/invertase (TIGR01784 family)
MPSAIASSPSRSQLTLAPEPATVGQAKALIERVQQEAIGNLSRNEIIEIITTIAVYKFANLSREDVEAMLGLKLEDSRIYQEAEAEGERKNKLKMVPKLFAKGFSVEKVAEIVELTVEEIRQIQHQ